MGHHKKTSILPRVLFGVIALGVLTIVLIVVFTTRSSSPAPEQAVPVPTPVVTTQPSLPSTETPIQTPILPSTSSIPPSPPPATSAPKILPLVYTVKPGDTLNAIAQWFSFHDYQALFDANRDYLGDNPNLIFPGQRIVLSANGMSINP